MTDMRRNSRPNREPRRASLADIELEVASIKDTMDRVSCTVEDGSPLWLIAVAVDGLAWAVHNLATHHEDLAVSAAMERKRHDQC